MNRPRPREHLDVGFESHSRHGCLCAFILCLCFLCVDSGLATGSSPIQGVLPTVYRIKKLKNWAKFQGSTTIQRERECGSLYLDHLVFRIWSGDLTILINLANY
jgi:hypothetical protein